MAKKAKDRRNDAGKWAYPDDYQRNAASVRAKAVRTAKDSGRRPAHHMSAGRPQEHTRPVRQRSRYRKLTFSAVMLIFISVLLITVVVFALVIHDIYFASNGPLHSDMNYEIISAKENNIPASEAFSNDTLYVDFTLLADQLGMYEIGDSSTMRFVVPSGDTVDSNGTGNEEYVVFTIGTLQAEVNAQKTYLSQPSRLIGMNIWVPMDFVSGMMNGLDVSVKTGRAVISRKTDDSTASSTTSADTSAAVETDKSGKTYESISFRQKNDGEIALPSTGSSTSEATQTSQTQTATDYSSMGFKTDLNSYEKYMNPDGNDYLVLVNTTHTLSSDYVPSDLTNVVNTRSDRAAQQMRLYAEKALEALYIEMKASGYTDVSVTSGYRSYSYQTQLFSSYVSQEMSKNSSLTKEAAEAKVATYSARPGTSEHQSGLCCDMHNLSAADVSFKDQPAYTWLSENAWKFGFVLRFPDGKTDKTGISFEPWHYRYVGRYHASRMKDLGMCLEEYIDYTGINVSAG